MEGTGIRRGRLGVEGTPNPVLLMRKGDVERVLFIGGIGGRRDDDASACCSK